MREMQGQQDERKNNDKQKHNYSNGFDVSKLHREAFGTKKFNSCSDSVNDDAYCGCD